MATIEPDRRWVAQRAFSPDSRRPKFRPLSPEETAAWDAEDLSHLEAEHDMTGNEGDQCYLGNHSKCEDSSCNCPHHDPSREFSGACSDGDCGDCQMSHGASKEDCWCPMHNVPVGTRRAWKEVFANIRLAGGKCLGCGKRVHDDEFPLDSSNSEMTASDYDMVGPTHPFCFMCANDSDRYFSALERAKKTWRPKDERDKALFESKIAQDGGGGGGDGGGGGGDGGGASAGSAGEGGGSGSSSTADCGSGSDSCNNGCGGSHANAGGCSSCSCRGFLGAFPYGHPRPPAHKKKKRKKHHASGDDDIDLNEDEDHEDYYGFTGSGSCDYGHFSPEVRRLPTGDHSAVNVCRDHYAAEAEFRNMRQQDNPSADWSIEPWDELEHSEDPEETRKPIKRNSKTADHSYDDDEPTCEEDDKPSVAQFLGKHVCREHLEYALKDAPDKLRKAEEGIGTTSGPDRLVFENQVQQIKADVDKGQKALADLALKDNNSDGGLQAAAALDELTAAIRQGSDEQEKPMYECERCGVQATREAATLGRGRRFLCDEHAASYKSASDSAGLVTRIFEFDPALHGEEKTAQTKPWMYGACANGNHDACTAKHGDNAMACQCPHKAHAGEWETYGKPTGGDANAKNRTSQHIDLSLEGSKCECGHPINGQYGHAPNGDCQATNGSTGEKSCPCQVVRKAASVTPQWITDAGVSDSVEKKATNDYRCGTCQGDALCNECGGEGCSRCEGTGSCPSCYGTGAQDNPHEEYDYVRDQRIAKFASTFGGTPVCPGCELSTEIAKTADTMQEPEGEGEHSHASMDDDAVAQAHANEADIEDFKSRHPWAEVQYQKCPGCGEVKGAVICKHEFHEEPLVLPLPKSFKANWNSDARKWDEPKAEGDSDVMSSGVVPDAPEHETGLSMEDIGNKPEDERTAMEANGLHYVQRIKERDQDGAPIHSSEQRVNHPTYEGAMASHNGFEAAGFHSEVDPVTKRSPDVSGDRGIHDLHGRPTGSKQAQDYSPKGPTEIQLKGKCKGPGCTNMVHTGEGFSVGDDRVCGHYCAEALMREQGKKTAQNLGCPNCNGTGSLPSGGICPACFGTGHGGGLMLKGGSSDDDNHEAWAEKGSQRCNHRGCLSDDLDEVYDNYGIYAGRYCSKHEKEAPGQWDYAGPDTESLDEDYPNPQRGYYSSTQAPDEGMIGFIYGDDGSTFRSVDGGETWDKVGTRIAQSTGSAGNTCKNCGEPVRQNGGNGPYPERYCHVGGTVFCQPQRKLAPGELDYEPRAEPKYRDVTDEVERLRNASTEHTPDENEEDDDIKLFRFDHGPGQGDASVHSDIHQQEHTGSWAKVSSGCGRCGRGGHTSEACPSNKGSNVDVEDTPQSGRYLSYDSVRPIEAAAKPKKKVPTKDPIEEHKKKVKKMKDDIVDAEDKVIDPIAKALKPAYHGAINPGSGPTGTSIHDLVDNVPALEPYPTAQRPFITDHKGEVGHTEPDNCKFCGEPMQDHAQWNITQQPGNAKQASAEWDEIGWMDVPPQDKNPRRGE